MTTRASGKAAKKKAPAKNAKAAAPKEPTAAEKLAAVGLDEICRLTADCVPQRTIAADIGVSWATLMLWLSDEGRTEQYTRAREAQADKMAEDLLAIADEEVTMVRRSKHQQGAKPEGDTEDNEVEVVFDPTAVARNRLRVDARKWLASKMAPKRYGDKVAVGGADDLGPLVVEITRFGAAK